MASDRPPRRRVAISFKDDPGKTKQEFIDDSNINVIVKRWLKGQFVPLQNAQPLYGDFSNVDDYLTAVNNVRQAQAEFDALPSAIRNRFQNDPAQLISFLADPNNQAEAEEIGLVDKGVPINTPPDGGGAPVPANTESGGDSPPPPVTGGE